MVYRYKASFADAGLFQNGHLYAELDYGLRFFHAVLCSLFRQRPNQCHFDAERYDRSAVPFSCQRDGNKRPRWLYELSDVVREYYDSAIMGIDTGLYEAAEIDGCTPNQMFWRLTLPLIRPILVYVIITSMIGGLQIFDVPQILTNGKGSPDRCATTVIMYLNNHMYSKNYGMAGAVSTVLFVICAVLCLLVLKTLNRERQGGKK